MGAPPDFDDVHARTWAALSGPGDWLDGAARVGVAREVRRSADCATCHARAAGSSPGNAGAEHGPADGLIADLVDLAHRVTRDNTRLTRSWAEAVMARVGVGAYTEAVGIAASVRVMDTFRRCIGRDPEPLPAPRPGEPAQETPKGIGDVGAWVPQSLEKTRANVTRALSSVPRTDGSIWRPLVDAHYARGAEFASFTWNRALSRPQIELVASTVTHENECFY